MKFLLESPGELSYRGELVLPVESAEAAAQNIQIVNQQETGGRMSVGTEQHVNINISGRQDQSWTDEVRYTAVELYRVGSDSASRVAGGIKRPLFDHPAGAAIFTRISLRIRKGKAVRHVCLLGGTSVRLGKQRGNDIVLRLLPPDPQEDALWGRISRNHAEIHLTPHGAEWRNGPCTNGTMVDGRKLAANQSMPLRPAQLLRPADVLGLQCTQIAESPIEATPDAYTSFERRLGRPQTEHAPTGPLAALRINRVGNFDHLEEYLLIQRGCTLGSDLGCGIVIPDGSVSMRHALILFNSHGFWLEPLQRQSPTSLDGEQIPLHRLVRLTPGMSPLRLGDVEIGVSAWQQWFVDVPMQ
ncbi:MAG: FHA domain-containing protein [Planctomycetaceae bacterium]